MAPTLEILLVCLIADIFCARGSTFPNALLLPFLTPTRKDFCVAKRRLCRPLAAPPAVSGYFGGV